MSVASRITAIEEHIGDIYDTLEIAGTTETTKNIVNINSNLKDRLKYFINNGVEIIWNNWEKVIGTGTEFTLNNTTQAPMSIIYKGNTYQETDVLPSPDYPQDIHVVSGDNEVKVEGKNLVDQSKVEINKKIYSTGAYTSPTGTNTTDYIYVGNFTNITIVHDGGDDNWNTCWFDENKNVVSGGGNGYSSSKQTLSVGTKKYIKFSYKTTCQPALYGDLDISTYEPYQSQTYPINLGNIELCKIGDYQDYFYKDNGKWYLHKETGKVVYDGTEIWNRFEISSNVIQYYRDLNTKHDANIPLAKSNYFRSGVISQRGLGYENSVYTYTGGIAFNPNSFPTTEDWKTWLSTHNTTVYYVLDTPTTTEITDTTLLSQLEAIKYSYDEQTNISQDNDDLPFILDVTALKNI